MQRRSIGVIDIGKTNVKYVVVERGSWREVVVLNMANKVDRSGPYPHYDVDRIWDFLINAIKELQADYPVSALSVTTHGASAALLDGAGELAMPILDYEHDGPDSMKSRYDEVRPPFEQTGSPRLPMGLNLGAQIFWQMQHFPDAATHVEHIVTYPQYWTYRLTGVLANEVTSLGCHTDLWNPWERKFSTLVDAQGWTRLMAPVRKASETLGTITQEVAKATGLPPETPVVCGIHDSNASLYPQLTNQRMPFSVISTGTWVICMAIGGGGKKTDPSRDTLVNVNALGDPVPSARFMGGREFDVLMKGYNARCSVEEMNSVLERGIMLMPAVENRSGPFQGCDAHWVGEEPQDDAIRYAAVSMYLALMTGVSLDLIGADGVTIVEGPFAENESFLLMLSSITGRPALASSANLTGTSVGAAMLACPDESAPNTVAGTPAHSSPNLRGANAYANAWRTLAEKSLRVGQNKSP